VIDIRIIAPDDCPHHVLDVALHAARRLKHDYPNRRAGPQHLVFWDPHPTTDHRRISAWWTATRRITVRVSEWMEDGGGQ